MFKQIAAFAAVLALSCPAFATLTTTTNTASYTGNGSTKAFTVPFKFLANTDLVVTVAGVTQALGSNYTVKGAGAATGTVTMTNPPASGAAVVITRSVPLTQTTSLRQSRAFDPATIENALDKRAMAEQQLAATHATDKAAQATTRLSDLATQAARDSGQDAATLAINNSVAALNTGSHAVGDTTSILAFGTTTPRTLTARFADFTMLKDMGAACNGTTDDTAAVNSAIAKGVPVISPATACKTTGALGIIQPGSLILNGVRTDAGAELSAQSATQIIVSKLTKGVEDAFITVVSDSTSYTSGYLSGTPNPIRWVTRFGTGIGARFPAYTVKFNEWDDATQAYLGWVTLQTGTGAQTLWISNASFSGMDSTYALGTHLTPMVIVTAPDLIIWSHGHNEQLVSRSYSWIPDITTNIEELAAAVPKAAILIVGQNPRAAPAVEPTTQALRIARYAEIAARRGYGFLNVYQAFIDYGPTWAADLLNADGIHPNDAGSQLWADETVRAFTFSRFGALSGRLPPAFGSPQQDQLLQNGDFSAFDNGVPAHWAAVSGPTIALDTVHFESTNGYALKLTGAGYIVQSLPVRQVAGKCVTLAARTYVVTGQPNGFGSIVIRDNMGNTASTYVAVNANMFDAWRWKSVQRCFDPAITSAEIRLYPDFNTATGTITYDRVSLVLGLVPSDVPTRRNATRYFRVNADASIATTTLTQIPGLTWTIPPSSDSPTLPVPFDCYLLYTQPTATSLVGFGLGATSGMLNVAAAGRIYTSAIAFTSGTMSGTTGGPVLLTSATPSAITTIWAAEIHGMKEEVPSASVDTFGIYASAASGSVTIKRGSYCLVKFN